MLAHVNKDQNKGGLSRKISSLPKLSLIWLLTFAGIAALLSAYLGEIHELTDPPIAADFYKFYLSSRNLLEDKSPYWVAPDRTSPTSHCNPNGQIKINQLDRNVVKAMPEETLWCLHPNLNPPLFVALTIPLALLDYSQAWWTWSLASLFSGILALSLAFKSDAFPTSSTTTKTIIGLAFFAYYPTFANSSYGQVSLFLLLDITLAWLALRNKKNLTSGCWLGLAASIKPFFGLFLIGFLVSKNWRAASAFIAVLVISFMLGGFLVGFSAYTAYFKILNEVNWLAESWNASFAGFFSRLFGGPAYNAWMNTPIIGRGLTTVCNLATAYVLSSVIFKQSKSSDQKLYADCLVALTIPAMLLLSPLGWTYYFPMMFISFVVIWNLTANLTNGRVYRLLLLLVTIPTIPSKPLLTAIHAPRVWFWDAGVYFYLLLFTFSLIAFLAYQVGNKQVADHNK